MEVVIYIILAIIFLPMAFCAIAFICTAIWALFFGSRE